MNTNQQILLYVNEAAVDEIWVSLKRSGVPTERVQAAVAKVSGTAKFGLGKVWSWLATDLNLEATGAAETSFTQKLAHTAVLRALLLQELLVGSPDTTYSNTFNIESNQVQNFVRMICTDSYIIPIPTIATFSLQMMLAAIVDGDEADQDISKVADLYQKMAANRRAFAFYTEIFKSENKKNSFHMLFDELESEFMNAMALSNDDQLLFLSPASTDRESVLCMSFMDEKYLRRNLVGFTGNRPVDVFGRIAMARILNNGTRVIGVDPISIALA